MAPAVFNSTKVEFTNTDSKWTVSGQMLEFDGFLKAYGKTSEDENKILPKFNLSPDAATSSVKMTISSKVKDSSETHSRSAKILVFISGLVL